MELFEGTKDCLGEVIVDCVNSQLNGGGGPNNTLQGTNTGVSTTSVLEEIWKNETKLREALEDEAGNSSHIFSADPFWPVMSIIIKWLL